MSGVNTVLISGICERPALRVDDAGKFEFRWTLRQTDGAFNLYVPCCASGAANGSIILRVGLLDQCLRARRHEIPQSNHPSHLGHGAGYAIK